MYTVFTIEYIQEFMNFLQWNLALRNIQKQILKIEGFIENLDF